MSEFAVHSDNPNITGTHKNFCKDVAAHMLSVPLPPTLGKRYRDADRKFLIKPLKETKKILFFSWFLQQSILYNESSYQQSMTMFLLIPCVPP